MNSKAILKNINNFLTEFDEIYPIFIDYFQLEWYNNGITIFYIMLCYVLKECYNCQYNIINGAAALFGNTALDSSRII